MGDPTLSDQAQNSTGKKKILIVEDDFFIRDLYELQARKSGFDVILASDGLEAVEKTKTENPDILLIDLMLPKMDGLTVMKTIKADPKFERIPCIIVTNLEDANKEQDAKNSGASDYLLKIKNTPEMIIKNLESFLR